MELEEYRRKRNFRKTPEPRPDEPPFHAGHSYLIQKHDATRLHYDLRLELDGVLLSWAVTKGPSVNPADKRLAVHALGSRELGACFRSACKRQEFVIIGYTAAKSGARAIGALHVGYNEKGELKYAGKVGTGFGMKTAKDLYDRPFDISS